MIKRKKKNQNKVVVVRALEGEERFSADARNIRDLLGKKGAEKAGITVKLIDSGAGGAEALRLKDHLVQRYNQGIRGEVLLDEIEKIIKAVEEKRRLIREG